MFGMAISSISLFLRGRLFAEPAKVFRQIFIGVAVAAVLLVVAVKLGLGLWLATLIASFVGGALQPYLFKDLRYR